MLHIQKELSNIKTLKTAQEKHKTAQGSNYLQNYTLSGIQLFTRGPSTKQGLTPKGRLEDTKMFEEMALIGSVTLTQLGNAPKVKLPLVLYRTPWRKNRFIVFTCTTRKMSLYEESPDQQSQFLYMLPRLQKALRSVSIHEPSLVQELGSPQNLSLQVHVE